MISNKTITRTIKYVDAEDPNKEVADSRTDTVQLSQGFTVNNYTVTSNGWTSGTFEAVPSPDLSAKGYKAADQATVDASTVTNGDSDQTIVVKYAHDTAVRTADDPGSLPVSDLQKTVTRTIRYVDATGKQLAEPTVQTVTLKREATEDLVTKQVLSYGDWTVASGDWSAVPVPETLASGDYTTPKVNGEAVSTVTADSVTADSSDQTVTVVYQEKDAAEKNNAGQKNDQNQSGSGDRNVNGGQSSTGTNASAQDKQSRTNDSVSATATSAVKKVEAVSSGLPETAKQVVTNPFGIAGLAALSAASYAFFTKKRRDEK
ncbi:mucin-binding protein [Fructobacillus papyrifericola]|uniref:Gram-positive cocci surface proteins LPxTG domain-containing protein n=1 Tax=Fructobacillus papyrifericola TaxID=2713172 RepID=A0ABS5QSN7_9LACO|nr:MucBP domain-containing protein [Fructobacillus papyrifericola]MBS9335852.1 hypothetical protein [Fructobacillus papyrifericola]